MLVTSATQIDHLFQVAIQDGMDETLRDELCRIVIGSIGPIAS
jgi:hypothetical protein